MAGNPVKAQSLARQVLTVQSPASTAQAVARQVLLSQ